jgi:UDP-N-acetylglucosamine--N-acetylmuramyl-(pentapeptide) pyrophosphoryl-undecaprenol N-acetylglucosamine transferase
LSALKESGIQVLWQTGKFYFQDAQKAAESSDNPNLTATDFVMRMDYAYSIADLVISRAGASSISELCLLGKPSILVPSPNVAEDHQTKNAMALVNQKATLMITDANAPKTLIAEAVKLINDNGRLKHFSENIHAMAQPNSADRIAEVILELVSGEKG